MDPETSGYHPLDMTVLLKGLNVVLELAFTHSEYPRYVLQSLLEDGGLEEVVRRIGARDDTSLVTVREVIQIMDDVIATDATFAPDALEVEESFFPAPTAEVVAPTFPEPRRHDLPQNPPTERVLLQQIEAVIDAWRTGEKTDAEALRAVKKYLARHMFLTRNTSMSEVGATVQNNPVQERDTPPRA